VRDDLEAEARREGDAEVRRQLLEEIESANSVDAPRPMVQRVMSAFAEAYKVPDDQLEKFAAEFAPVAERQVKRDLIIDHIAEKESLKATEEELDSRIEEIAQRQNTDPSKVYSSLQKAKRLNELERSIIEEKVFNYLMEQSTIVDETS
jgi:trigger factor